MFKTYRLAISSGTATLKERGKIVAQTEAGPDQEAVLDWAFNWLLREQKRGTMFYERLPHPGISMDRGDTFLITTLPTEEPNAAD